MKLKTTKERREQIRERYDDYEAEAELCDDFATLEAELASARSAMQEAHRERNFMVLRQWLEQHPEPEK